MTIKNDPFLARTITFQKIIAFAYFRGMLNKVKDLNGLLTDYLPFFQKFGMTEASICNHYETWKQGRKEAQVSDFLMHLFQVLLQETAKQASSEKQFYSLKRSITLRMAEFLKSQNRNANLALKQVLEADLRLHELETDKAIFHVKIQSGNCCPYCDALKDKIISIEDGLLYQYLASDKCTNPRGCTCHYMPLPLKV
jgi:hypothetical protein